MKGSPRTRRRFARDLTGQPPPPATRRCSIMRERLWRLLSVGAVLVCLSLFAAACGGDDAAARAPAARRVEGYLRRRRPGRSGWGSSRGSATARGGSRRRRGCSRRRASTRRRSSTSPPTTTSTRRSRAGQLEAGNIATHTAMTFIAAGLPIRIVALLDVVEDGGRDRLGGSVTDDQGAEGQAGRLTRRAPPATSC